MGMVGLRDVLVVAPAATFHPQHHHHHHHHHHDGQLLSPVEHPIIPLLAAAPCLVDDSDAVRSRIPTFWQNQQQQQPTQHPQYPNPSASSYLRKPMPVAMLDSSSANSTAPGILNASVGGGGVGGVVGASMSGGAGSSSTSTCQDCGNQAKKDCSHRRCRTCCKSRGFDCSTHVRSTWVPAARRRERQLSCTGGVGAGSSASTSATKKPRLITSHTTAAANINTTTASHTSTSNTTPPRSFDTSSSHQDASFRESLPGHVRAPAVFKCVRVTPIDDGEDEYAYQAMVRIGGHVFKGFLYDQGVEARDNSNNTHRTSSGDNNNIPSFSELHLGGNGGGGPSDLYAPGPSHGGGLMGGTAYGNPIN